MNAAGDRQTQAGRGCGALPEADVRGRGSPCSGRRPAAFTLLELLVVLTILAVLAALLLPTLARTKRLATRAACLAQLREQGVAWRLYLDENEGRFPDRRDLKESLPGGYKPWTTWPPSDPRAGWAAVVLRHLLPAAEVWTCPALSRADWANIEQTGQAADSTRNAPVVRYWMWRFDRKDDPVPLDNFWGRTEAEAVASLRAANQPNVGLPSGPADVELTVDVYFPGSVPSLPAQLRGRAAHPGGRNRLLLDGHVRFARDARLSGN